MNEKNKQPEPQVKAAAPTGAMQDLREVPFSEVKQNYSRIMATFSGNREVRCGNMPSKN